MNGAYKRTDTTKLAVSALCLALTVAALVGASLIPGTEMTFYAIAGLFTGVVIMENGLKGGALVYVGALILSFILVPNKFAILPYGLFFGLYGFVKYFTEKISAAWAQIVVKIIFFGVISAASLKFFKGLFLGNIELPDMPMAIIIIGGVIMFLLYDYIFTLAVNIYRKRIKREKIDFRLSEDQNGDEERKGQ
jgi:hypothetical protein